MDTDAQLYETDAGGWKRGVYDDVQRTFRAPVVNWIFRTWMANYPESLRYAWGQLKPIFETARFARYSVGFRDDVLSAVEADLPAYRRTDAGVDPAAYRELRSQLATFDVVGPRLTVLFETMDRALDGSPVGETPASDRAATAPFPDWLDADRGGAPTMVAAEELPAELEDVVDSIREFHGFENQLPSIYRCLAQWPAFLETLWADVEPALDADAFDRGVDAVDDRTSAFVAELPYRPRLSPDDLRAAGVDDEAVEDLRELFETFNRGPVRTVLPALPVFAATVDAAGVRKPL